MAGQTIVVRRPENPWLRALLPVAMDYIGGQIAEGRERAARAAQNQAELDLFRAMTQGNEGAEEQAAPTLYDMAPDAVAARAAGAMRGQAGSYAPARFSPEEMYERLLRPRERTALPSEQEVLMRGLNSPYAKRVGLDGVKRTADMANAMYAPARAEAAAREKDRLIGELLPRGGDLRSDPNVMLATAMRLAAAGFDENAIAKIMDITHPNHSFQDVDLGDRRAFGAFDPVTGRARLETHAMGVDPTRAMEQREMTRREAMAQRAKSSEKWTLKEGADGKLYRVDPVTGKSSLIEGVTLPQDVKDRAGEWTLETDVKGNMWRVNKLTGAREPLDMQVGLPKDEALTRATTTLEMLSRAYPYGLTTDVPAEHAALWRQALKVQKAALEGALGGGVPSGDPKVSAGVRESLRKQGFSDEEIDAAAGRLMSGR